MKLTRYAEDVPRILPGVSVKPYVKLTSVGSDVGAYTGYLYRQGFTLYWISIQYWTVIQQCLHSKLYTGSSQAVDNILAGVYTCPQVKSYIRLRNVNNYD